MRNQPIREWLENLIDATERPPGCPRCGTSPYPCPRHAAEAVLHAARREDLIIMERFEADQVIEEARAEARVDVPLSRYWPEPAGFRGKHDRVTATLTGTLTYLQRHTSPQGLAYMTGVLRLDSGEVAVEVLPKYYAEIGGVLAEGETRVLTGKVDRRGPIPSLAVTGCQPVDGGCPGATSAGHGHGCCDLWVELTAQQRANIAHLIRDRPVPVDWSVYRRCPICGADLGKPCASIVGAGRGFPVESRGPHAIRRLRTARRLSGGVGDA